MDIKTLSRWKCFTFSPFGKRVLLDPDAGHRAPEPSKRCSPKHAGGSPRTAAPVDRVKAGAQVVVRPRVGASGGGGAAQCSRVTN